MNYFVVCNGLLYLGATWWSFAHGRIGWGVVWLCYGVSALALAYLEA